MNDTISREAVADAINGIECTRHTTWYEFYQKVMTAVEKLQPAEPKRGKWIDKGITGDWQYQTDGKGRSWHEWQCDQCKDMVKKRSFYCPNCGADMRGEQDG